MEQEITAQAEGEAHGAGGLKVFLIRSFSVVASVGLGVFAVLYAMGVTFERAAASWRDHWAVLTMLGMGVLTVWSHHLCKRILGALVDSYSARMAVVDRVCVALSILCLLLFATCAAVGIWRGYAVQSEWPMVVFFEGVVLLAAGSWSTRKINRTNVPFIVVILLCSLPLKGKEWFALLYVLLAMLPAILGRRIVAGRHSEKQRERVVVVAWLVFIAAGIIWMVFTPRQRHLTEGQSYYWDGRYKEALKEFEAERRDWSKHIMYEPYDDGVLMTMLAKTYCQLDRFGEARRTYELMGERYVNKWADDVGEDLERLDEGLALVNRYEAWVKGEEEFPYDIDPTSGLLDSETRKYFVLSDVARTLRFDLKCDAKALEVYRRMLELDISEAKKVSVEKKIRQLRRGRPL